MKCGLAAVGGRSVAFFFLKCHVVKLWRVLYYFQEERLNFLPLDFFFLSPPLSLLSLLRFGQLAAGWRPRTANIPAPVGVFALRHFSRAAVCLQRSSNRGHPASDRPLCLMCPTVMGFSVQCVRTNKLPNLVNFAVTVVWTDSRPTMQRKSRSCSQL